MKKIVAVLVCISILVSQAQAITPVRPVKTAIPAARSVQYLVLRSAANAGGTGTLTLPIIQVPLTFYPKTAPSLASTNSLDLSSSIEHAAYRASGAQNLTLEQILYRANHGKTAFLPRAILDLENIVSRSQALRTAFVTAAADGEADAEQVEVALQFWRTDLLKNIAAFKQLPSLSIASLEELLPVVQSLQDISGLALCGGIEDTHILQRLFTRTTWSGFEPVMAALVTRSLLGKGQWAELENFFANNPGRFAELQNGMAAYVAQENLPLQIPTTQAIGQPLPDKIRNILQGWGPVLANATDGSLAATQQWMKWAQKQQPLTTEEIAQPTHPATATGATPLPVRKSIGTTLLTNLENAADAPIQTAALPTLPALPALPSFPTEPAFPPEVSPVIAAAPAPADAPAPEIQNQPLDEGVGANIPDPNSFLARLQRASLYGASLATGLELAAPVVTNFGTSFGLSLENNILVISATYGPYALGSLISNQIKQYLGRKVGINLGLAMMLTGFAGGIGWAGLDGSFALETDSMMQFYKALACITLASTGGVFVHNSVGPLLADLNQAASELVRQKQGASSEFFRAGGMWLSFAFPFVATKLLEQDWSFTFTMALPLVAASLLGVNLTRLPNTRPAVTQAAQAVSQASGSWLQNLRNNPYVRLFQEDKAALPLLLGLLIMNGVEVTQNNGFLLLLPSLISDPSSQYLFGLVQFAVPFLFGRYLAKYFLTLFSERSLTMASSMVGVGTLTALIPWVTQNVYALTSALFFAETGISTLFTLSIARTARNPHTADRLMTLIDASALSCAIGPVILSSITQLIMNAGVDPTTATTIGMLGIPAVIAVLTSQLFRQVETDATGPSAWTTLVTYIKKLFSGRNS